MNPPQTMSDYFRFCPGDEAIRLSDAVCRGRRRSNFPKCKGCQFNDDEARTRSPLEPGAVPGVAPATLPPALAPDRTLEAIEKAKRDRIDAVFGPYDVRGIYPDPLDVDVAWRVGYAVAQFLRSELRGYDRSRPEKGVVAVGRDMRKSSPELQAGLIEGLRSGGSPVIDIGLVDTPQLYFAVNHLSCAGGVQVTASHNPAAYNGFKICGQKGRPVGQDTGLGKISRIARNTLRHSGNQPAPLRQSDLTGVYRAFVLSHLRAGTGFSAERPMRIVVDASNGMAGRWFPVLFGGIDWIELVPLNFEHNGEFVHDPNPLVESNLVQVVDRMSRAKAVLGVCFDGDADRCVFIDEQARPVRGDLMTALLARHFLRESAGSTIVYDLRCSRVVLEEIRKAGGVPRRERCGHTYLKKAMADAKGLFGGELSGHYYFRDNWFCDSGMLAVVSVLNLLTETGQPLSELVAPLRRYAHSGERNFRNDRIEETLKGLTSKYAGGQIDLLDGVTVQFDSWWFNVRAAGTEPLLRLNLEARDEVLLSEKLAEIVPLLGTPVPG